MGFSGFALKRFTCYFLHRRENGHVGRRWQDSLHALVTELAESGAGDEVIMSIAGDVSRAMLSRYSDVRREAKRRALRRDRRTPDAESWLQYLRILRPQQAAEFVECVQEIHHS